MNDTPRGILLAALVALGIALPLSAQQSALRVVATNSWTAAFAAAAGAADIVTLAPSDLRHPAEYELKPSDVAALQGAELIVYTGFEVMAKKIAEAAGSGKIRLLQIDADYSLATMRASILAIADVTGTQPKARASIASLESFLVSWKTELRSAGLHGAPVVVHLFQQPLMEELGFDVTGVFGPGPPGGGADRKADAPERALHRGQLAQRGWRAPAGNDEGGAFRVADQLPRTGWHGEPVRCALGQPCPFESGRRSTSPVSTAFEGIPRCGKG